MVICVDIAGHSSALWQSQKYESMKTCTTLWCHYIIYHIFLILNASLTCPQHQRSAPPVPLLTDTRLLPRLLLKHLICNNNKSAVSRAEEISRGEIWFYSPPGRDDAAHCELAGRGVNHISQNFQEKGPTAQLSNLGVHKDITSTVFELQKWFLHQNRVEFYKKCNANDRSD